MSLTRGRNKTHTEISEINNSIKQNRRNNYKIRITKTLTEMLIGTKTNI